MLPTEPHPQSYYFHFTDEKLRQREMSNHLRSQSGLVAEPGFKPGSANGFDTGNQYKEE